MIGLAVRVVGFLGALAVLAFIPTWVSQFRASELAYVGIYVIAILGLNLLTGYTGQISLAQGAFMAIGGYVTALLIADHGVKDVATLPLAGLAAGVAGALFGLPALRLRGMYLALAFAVAVSTPAVIAKFEDRDINLFGEPGLTASLTPLEVFGHELVFEDWLYYLTWTIAAALFVVAWLLLRGRVGRHSGPFVTARSQPPRPASIRRRTRPSPSASRRSTLASPAVCTRWRRRS